MTEQIKDTIIFDNQLWDVDDNFNDLCLYVPKIEAFGLNPNHVTTANWSRTRNHFFVSDNELYLFKIELSLSDVEVQKIPKGLRYEKRIRYEPMYTFRDGDEYIEVNEYVDYFLVFDNYKLDYTGNVIISQPAGDLWEHPVPEKVFEPASKEDIRMLELSFEDGCVV